MIHNVIPTPKKCELAGGTSVLPFFVSCDVPEWNEHVSVLSEAFKKLHKSSLSLCEGGIVLKKDDSISKGAYRIDTCEGAVLSACDSEGILYDIATFIQAAEVSDGKITVERALIEDFADKEYRSLMVDLAREWHPAYTVHQ